MGPEILGDRRKVLGDLCTIQKIESMNNLALEGGMKSDLTPSYLLCRGAKEGGKKSDLTPSEYQSFRTQTIHTQAQTFCTHFWSVRTQPSGCGIFGHVTCLDQSRVSRNI